MTWKAYDLYVVGGATFADVDCNERTLSVIWRNDFSVYPQEERVE